MARACMHGMARAGRGDGRLAGVDPKKAALVELRFFGGLTFEEAATALGVSLATVKRDWALARAWLYRELSGS